MISIIYVRINRSENPSIQTNTIMIINWTSSPPKEELRPIQAFDLCIRLIERLNDPDAPPCCPVREQNGNVTGEKPLTEVNGKEV
jgi:hypothetical protein